MVNRFSKNPFCIFTNPLYLRHFFPGGSFSPQRVSCILHDPFCIFTNSLYLRHFFPGGSFSPQRVSCILYDPFCIFSNPPYLRHFFPGGSLSPKRGLQLPFFLKKNLHLFLKKHNSSVYSIYSTVLQRRRIFKY